MGKVYGKRAALGNHQRQAAQADMLLHGWRPIVVCAMYNFRFAIWHDEHGRVAKDGQGTYVRNITGHAAYPEATGGFSEWDDLGTHQVLWLYKVLRREKLL